MTSTVPPGRGHRNPGTSCLATIKLSLRDKTYPGTSCLATIKLSLRDKSHSPIEAPHNYLSAYGVNPGLNGAKIVPFNPGHYTQFGETADT